MNVGGLTFNDLIQYVLIAALVVSALADRAVHRAYIIEMTRQHNEILKLLGRVIASVEHKDAAP